MDTLDYTALTRGQRIAYLDALTTSHRIRLDLKLRNRNEEPIRSLTAPVSRVLSGSVQVDTTADVSRSLDLTVLDPNDRMRFEADSPAEGAVFADRFVSVRYEVLVEALDAWVSVPVFWGVLTGYSRNGAEVTLEAQGKERLLLAPHYATQSYTLGKRMRLDDAIRRVATRAGEERFDLPDLDHRLQTRRAVTAQDEPWKVLSGGMENREGRPIPGIVERAPGDRRPYYSPTGRLTVRKLRRKPTYTFAEGINLLSRPQVTYDATEFINTVHVKGAAPKGKPAAYGRANLPANHPLSANKLSRNGEPRHMTYFVETELKTDDECRERAKQILERLAVAGVEASFDCLPAPHLLEDEFVRLRTDAYDFSFRLKQFTIPLTATDPMTVGANRPTRKWRRKRPSVRMTRADMSAFKALGNP
jgi:hypothetical protein